MSHSEFQLRGLTDPRLAVHATGALPVWLWSIDGTRILWANPVGARLFGAASRTALASRTFGPADPQRRQIAQLAPRLPLNGAIRLERLRGFGAPLGTLMTCGCARLDFSDSTHGVLIIAHTNGPVMPLAERLQGLVEGIEAPTAAFTRDGGFVAANDAARPLLDFRDLAEAGLNAARNDALSEGRFETSSDIGHIVLQRVGHGSDVALVALVVPNAHHRHRSATARSQDLSWSTNSRSPSYSRSPSWRARSPRRKTAKNARSAAKLRPSLP